MPRLTNSVPKYSKHRASGQAVVTLSGKDFYLGPHGTKASKLEYDRLVGEWIANGRRLQPDDRSDTSMAEIMAAYLRFAKGYYRKKGKITKTVDHIKQTIKVIRDLGYGPKFAADFGPLSIKAVMAKLVDDDCSRRYVNDHLDRIKRMLKWAVAEEMIPPSVYQAASAVSGLRRGRTKARETAPIMPIADELVDKTITQLPATVADMVRFQRVSGCRPGEVCIIRPVDIDRSGKVWSYTPESHKMEHHGRRRVILLGPKAQAVLTPYLLRPEDSYCFSPQDSERKRRRDQHARRKTPLSCGNVPGSNRKRRPKRSPTDRYDVASYRRSIHRACDKLKIDRWSPNRMRHTAATELRKLYGLEASRVILGHSKTSTTEIYAEKDYAAAARIAAEVG